MYYGSHAIDDFLTFGARTHTPLTSADVDADSVPTYDVYEDETGTPIVSAASMAKLNDGGSLGLYSERIQLTAGIGYEQGKSYHIDVHSVVAGVTSSELHFFQIEAHVDATSISAAQSSAQDIGLAVLDEFALIRTTIATLASQTSFTLTAGAPDDDAYNGGLVIVTDSATAVQKAVGEVLDYAQSTKTITLLADPGIFTMAVGDAVFILAASAASSVSAIADAVWNEAQADHVAAGQFGIIASEIASILADTNELQADWTDAGRLDLLLDAIKAVTDALPNSGALSDLATILADTGELQGDDVPGLIAALNDLSAANVNAEVVDVLRTDLIPDAVNVHLTMPTIAQAIYLILQSLTMHAVTGTADSIKKIDGSSELAVLTLDDADSPTSVLRSS